MRYWAFIQRWLIAGGAGGRVPWAPKDRALRFSGRVAGRELAKQGGDETESSASHCGQTKGWQLIKLKVFRVCPER